MYHPSQQLEILVVTAAPLHAHLHAILLLVARRVTTVADPRLLMEHLWERAPDLLLILSGQAEATDIALLCGQIRTYYQLPILVLERGAAEEERIGWLDAGADDVLSIAKGIPAELRARCHALVQRARRQQRRDPAAHRLHALEMQLDIRARQLYLPQGQPITLTENLTRFLAICFVHGDAVVPLEVLGLHIYGRRPADLRQRLTTLAQTLQERVATVVGPRPCLEIVRGHGYRLTVTPDSAPGRSSGSTRFRPRAR